jgi:pimeloyl-ACP methyl ester carboxylesterase
MKIPGATLYYERRGAGPLLVMIPGGPTDAAAFAALAAALAARYTTVAYDPRGNSRSRFDGEPVDQDMAVHADDARRLIDEIGGGPAFVLGSSGGGQIGLALAANHPSHVRMLVAHEPPCSVLLPDRDEIARRFAEIVAIYRRDGVRPAMEAFARLAGFDVGPPPANLPPEAAATMARVAQNLDYFLGHGVLPISSYRPEVARLGEVRVVVGIGRDSKEGQLAKRAARALANELGTEPVEFPGDHTGFGPHAVAFAEVLERVLRS